MDAKQTTIPGVRVPLIDEADATGRTAELYGLIKSTTGIPFIPDMFRLVSTRPELLEVLITGYNGVFSSGTLPRATREMIAAWTSKVNSCPYCVGTHNWFLTQFGGTEELTEAIANAASANDLPVDERTKVLMTLVTKVSTAAHRITDEDWAVATEAGWSNDELLEAVFCAGLFNFINRLVESLGLGSALQQSKIAAQADA